MTFPVVINYWKLTVGNITVISVTLIIHVYEMDLIDHLKQSLEDTSFSKTERNDFRMLLNHQPLDPEMVSLLRTRIYELASEKATGTNYAAVMKWMKDVNSVLNRQDQPSQAFFSPGDDCRNAIVRQLDGAVKQLKICVFTISDDIITRAILNAHRRGIVVEIITDNDKSFDHGSDIAQLVREGIIVKMDATRNHMHHKFMITDDRALITGSYNWTSSAARFNHENILLTYEPSVVKSFRHQFNQLWQQMH